MGGRRPRTGPRTRDAALPAPAAGRAQTRSWAAGEARAPASGRSDGGQAEARSAGTRARWDRRRRPPWAQGSRGQRCLRLCPPRAQPWWAGRQPRTTARPDVASFPGDARLSCCSRGPACLARPAWHRFLDTPTPRKQPAPPQLLPGPGCPSPDPDGEHSPLLYATQGQEQKPTPGRDRGGESIFSLLFFSSIKRIKNPSPVCVSLLCEAHSGALEGWRWTLPTSVALHLGRESWGGLGARAHLLLSLSSERLAERVDALGPAFLRCFQQGAA